MYVLYVCMQVTYHTSRKSYLLCTGIVCTVNIVHYCVYIIKHIHTYIHDIRIIPYYA